MELFLHGDLFNISFSQLSCRSYMLELCPHISSVDAQ